MVPPEPYAAVLSGDRASPHQEKVESPSSQETKCPTPAAGHRPPRLHEPFVSPEFAQRTESRGLTNAGAARPGVGIDTIRLPGNPRWGQPEAAPQTAPLYTVSGGASNIGIIVPPPASLPDSLLLTKRLAVMTAGCSSVVGSASVTGDIVLKGVEKGHHEHRESVAKASPGTSSQDEAETSRTAPPSPRDLSPLVIETFCTWGQKLDTILGQAALEPASADPRTAVPSSGGRPTLTTTGLFPHTMQLRFSCLVNVTSVHVRASSVFRLVVYPSEGLSGERRAGGKAVTVPIDGRDTGTTDALSTQDIDVDVRGESSFGSTRTLSVTITAGCETFCSVGRIYALGVRA